MTLEYLMLNFAKGLVAILDIFIRQLAIRHWPTALSGYFLEPSQRQKAEECPPSR